MSLLLTQQRLINGGSSFPHTDWRIYRDRAVYAALVGIVSAPLTTLSPPLPLPTGADAQELPRAYLDRSYSTVLSTAGSAGTSLALKTAIAYTLRPYVDERNYTIDPTVAIRSLWAQNLLQNTLFVAPAPPFAQSDWPVPKGLGPRQADCLGFSQGIRDYATGLNVPNQRQLDWPNPRGPARSIDALTWTQPLALQLIAPFSETDWPVPRGPARSIDALTWTAGFPFPILDYAVGLNDGNKRPSDWPVPKGPARSIDALTWTQTPAIIYTSQAVKPFLQTDWPLPVPRIYRQIADSSGFSSPVLDYAIGLNVPNQRQLDWPNPRGPARSIDALSWTQTLALQNTVPVAAPFFETDWPLPVPRVYRQIADSTGFPGPILDFAAGLNSANKRQYDWPNPRGPEPARKDFVAGFTEPIRDYAGGLNDSNKRPSDWPVPKGPARSIDALTWTQTLALGITSQGTKPFAQNDWPLSVPRVYRQIAETRGFEEPVLNFAIGLNDANKRKYDWPNPTGRPPLNVGYVIGFSETTRLQTIPFANLRNYDWPNPRGPRRSIDALSWMFTRTLLMPHGFVTVNISTEIELTVDFHICGWGTETQTSDGFTPASEQSDAWSEQEQSDDDYDEQDECGR